LPFRFWCQIAATVLCAALLVLTLAVPQWIEVLIGVEPDGGSGEAEWGIVQTLAAVTAVSAGSTVRTWRRTASEGA
jgi:hypothetical protein